MTETNSTKKTEAAQTPAKAPAKAPQDERTMRRERRQQMIDAGINPYPSLFQPNAFSAELEEKYAELGSGENTDDEVTLAGRVMAIRNQGKIAFVILKDKECYIKLFFRIFMFD